MPHDHGPRDYDQSHVHVVYGYKEQAYARFLTSITTCDLSFKMVSLKIFGVSALLFADAFAIQILYEVTYMSSASNRRDRTRGGQAVTDEQASRIKSNIYLWSQGNWAATEQGGMLKIYNVSGDRVRGVGEADSIISQMSASIDYHVRGGGAPPHTHRGGRRRLEEEQDLDEIEV